MALEGGGPISIRAHMCAAFSASPLYVQGLTGPITTALFLE